VSRCYKFHAATRILIAGGLRNTDHDQPMGYSDIKTLLVCAGFNYETAA